MTNSQLFKLAHTMTKQVIKAGDSYQVTFSQSLKIIKNGKPKAGIKLTMKFFK